jgi:glycosyltransferase involved in cell wall biosynthesis
MAKYNIKNKDFQFRLIRAGTKFINKVHEVPENLKTEPQSVIMLNDGPYILHLKTKEQQLKQNELYFNMQLAKNKPDKKIIYDSVIFTTEGISTHAVEEIYEWQNKKYEVKILDNNYIRNKDPTNKLANCYRAIDIRNDNYITIVNQPPSRWKQTQYLKNRIGYLAFEGNINLQWVKDINTSNMLELWCPSNYCKQCFIDSGVTIPISVIPHGVNDKFRKDSNIKKFNIFTFLWIGAPNAKRKNLDLMLQGFVKTFRNNPNINLLLKINKIYDPNMNIEKEINRFVPKEMLPQIRIIDEDIRSKRNRNGDFDRI